MADAGGHAEIVSSPGQGTSVVLTWSPPQPASAPVTDPLAWAHRMIPGPLLIFVGLMLPILGGFTGLAVLCARYLSQMQMTCLTAVGLAAANTVLAAVGSLAVAPWPSIWRH